MKFIQYLVILHLFTVYTYLYNICILSYDKFMLWAFIIFFKDFNKNSIKLSFGVLFA